MGYLLEIAKRRIAEAVEPVFSGQGNEINELNEVSPPKRDWPLESIDCERRFGQPHARLFPFIGRKVRTRSGPGTLLQVFAERVTVLLDSEMTKCAAFAPSEIEPVSWELSL